MTPSGIEIFDKQAVFDIDSHKKSTRVFRNVYCKLLIFYLTMIHNPRNKIAKRKSYQYLLAIILFFATSFLYILTIGNFHPSHTRILQHDPSPQIPSHIQMCRALVQPNLEQRVLVEESDDICHNLDRPHFSLLQIFASELISEVSRLNNIKVWYRHHCLPPPLPTIEEWLQHVFPIQEFLPSPLLTTDHAEAISMDTMVTVCNHCIQSFETEGFSSPECVLFNKPNPDEPLGIEMMTPSIQKNMKYASNVWAVQKNYPLIEELKNKAIVYINCRNDICTEMDTPGNISVDNLVYFLELPLHLHQIEIIAPTSCGDICEEKGKQLLYLMTRLYPSKSVILTREESTAALFSKMMTTGHLICSHSETCLIPAISQEIDKHTSFTINPEEKSLLSSLAGPSITESIFQKNVAFIDEKQTLMIGRNGKCRHVRGRFGTWVQDMEFAASLQYKGLKLQNIHGLAEIQFSPTNELPFRLPTTYRWETSLFPTCHVNDVIIRPSFCHVMKKLDIHRILFLGDSSVHSQAMSLWKAWGNGDDPYKDNDDSLFPNFTRQQECPGGTIEITYVRNDHLLEVNQPVSLREGVRNCGSIGFCYPWIESYLSFPGKTLIIAGMGDRSSSLQDFQYSIDKFIRTLDSFRRIDDILYVRTNQPAHVNCHVPQAPNRPKPLENYDQFISARPDQEVKTNTEFYNDYIHKVSFDRSLERSREEKNSKMRMEVLDVYPMISLRNDGHFGGEECVEQTCSMEASTRDCFHYFLPGPVDWLNHLLYNNLMDLGLEMEAYSPFVVDALKNP